MKIKNLLVLTLTVALVTISGAAQAGDGAKSFTDYLGQRITISRYGTVVNLRKSDGTEIPTDHSFRLCLANNDQCIESDGNGADTNAVLKTRPPTSGTTLKRGQSLVVEAAVRYGGVVITRKLSRRSGSTEIEVDETISAASPTLIVSYVERIGGLRDIPCPAPPPKCPGDLKLTKGGLELTKPFTVSPRRPLHAKYKFDLAKS